MDLNSDFTRRVALHSDEIAWQDSPTPGVKRRMLDRIGGEVARATTIVRYDAGSRFPAHLHDEGEEFLVLEGVFQDEHGDFPAGSYVRNPPGSSHAPGAENGCTILVKLRQFAPQDRTLVHIDINKTQAVPAAGRPGIAITPLFRDGREEVSIERWDPGTEVALDDDGGIELFVLEGGFIQEGETFRRHSWLRLPPRSGGPPPSPATAGPEGARLWIKSGHLKSPMRRDSED